MSLNSDKIIKLIKAKCIVGLIILSSALCAKVDIQDWSTQKGVEGSINIDTETSNSSLKEVIVAVIDTGVDPSHPSLKNKLVTYVNGKFKNATKSDYGRDFSPQSLTFKRPYDENGHGTHIASIIVKVSRNAKVLPIKYFNKNATEEENLNATIDAIKFAINSGVKIINYSSGGSGKSKLEKEVINLANKKGVLLIAAAGNFGEDIDKDGLQYYPASYNNQNIISVINHGRKYQVHKTSNFGQKSADISAPGTNILGAFPNERYGNLTGTSQSTAFVSATAAMIKGIIPDLSHQKIKNYILNGSTKVSNLHNKCISSGVLNVKKTINLVKEQLKRNFASNK